jgi:spore coat protein U-like protein
VKWISIVLTIVFLSFTGIATCESCTVTTTPAGFGDYDMSLSTPLDTVAEISATCAVAYTVKLDPGQNSMGDYHSRQMRSAAGDSTLYYNLYRDAARTEVWGDGIGNTFTRSSAGKGRAEALMIYGRIPPRQNVKTGLYTDSITVVLEW